MTRRAGTIFDATIVPVEVVTYNPDDPDTYPSVCVAPEEVLARFGFTGGETLLFDERGAYLGRLTDTVPGAPTI